MSAETWISSSLGGVVSRLNAGVSVNSEDREAGLGEIGVLKTSAVYGGRFDPAQHKVVLRTETGRVTTPVEADTILVSRMNTPDLVGESAYVRVGHPNLFLPDRLWQLQFRDRDTVSVRWLSFVLGSSRAKAYIKLNASSTSGSMKNLPKVRLLAMPLDLPSLPEQRRIAEILDTLDDAIRKTEQVIAKLQQMKQGLLHDLLTRGIDEQGELRDPDRHPEQFKDSPLGRIPRDWKVQPLGAVAEFITSGSRGWAAYYSKRGALFIRIGNLTRRHINLRYNSIVRVRPPPSSEGRRTSVKCGDILISITADLGIIGVVPSNLGEAYVNQHVALIRPLQTSINPRWAGHYLANGAGQTQFTRLNDQGAKAGLNLPAVAGLLTAIPPLAEQDELVQTLDGYDVQISREMRAADKLRTLKRGLMDDLLTGRVRVTVPNMETN